MQCKHGRRPVTLWPPCWTLAGLGGQCTGEWCLGRSEPTLASPQYQVFSSTRHVASCCPFFPSRLTSLVCQSHPRLTSGLRHRDRAHTGACCPSTASLSEQEVSGNHVSVAVILSTLWLLGECSYLICRKCW